MGKEEYNFQNSKIDIGQIITNLQEWISQQGYSTKVNQEGDWTVMKVTKGAALWKGQLSFHIQGDKERFSVLVDKGSSGMAFLKGGLIGKSMQKEVTQLADGALNTISSFSGAQRSH